MLPPGVSLAVDSAHPIRCYYSDSGQPAVTAPSCPTRAIAGTYGPQLASDDAGDPWDLPADRFFDIQFPLRSDRQLRGPAGGYCPQSVGEIATSPQRDCLLIALHVADGSTDPWLAPNEPLLVDPAPAAPSPTPPAVGPTPGPTPPNPHPAPAPTPSANALGAVTLAYAHLSTLAHRPLALSVHCLARCRGEVTLLISAATARRLHLGRRPIMLARGRFSAAAARNVIVHLHVPRRLATRLRRLHVLPVTVTAIDFGARRRVTHLTLRR